MSSFLTQKENCQSIVNWLYKVAEADNGIADDELKIIKGFAFTIGLENAERKDVGNVSLENKEVLFCLREMYRLATVDNSIAESEKKVIADFIQEYSIQQNVVEITEKWAMDVKRAQDEYDAAIAKINDL